MTAKHIPPAFELDAFNCPHCGVYAKQVWGDMKRSEEKTSVMVGLSGSWWAMDNWSAVHCQKCEKESLWLDDVMVFPLTGGAPEPDEDLPEAIRQDYEEARSVVGMSPRSAAALLRLSVQKLCAHLGEPGKSINDDIASLVAKGLDARLQKTLDSVRIIGNEAVHPGQIDLRDDRDTALALFTLVNIVVADMITKPKMIEGVWEKLPQGAREAVKRRDDKSLRRADRGSQ